MKMRWCCCYSVFGVDYMGWLIGNGFVEGFGKGWLVFG